MIYLTEKAAIKVKEIAKAEGINHFNIRIKVVGGGCSGFTYDMFYEDNITDMDEIVESDGTKIVVDPLSWQYLNEVSIDYVEGPISAGFKFNNPNVKSTCGCGSSFSV